MRGHCFVRRSCLRGAWSLYARGPMRSTRVPSHPRSAAPCTSESWRASLPVVVRGETTQQSRGLKRQAQAPRQGTLASGIAHATEMATRAVRPQHQEIRSARLGAHLDRSRQKAPLADIPTCCDGIADHRFRYSPLQSVTALRTDIIGFKARNRRASLATEMIQRMTLRMEPVDHPKPL